MYKLLNMTDYYEVNKIKKDIDFYKKNFGFDGIEIIRYNRKDLNLIKDDVIGYHLRFFPSILDLYRENYEKLYEELENIENIKNLCGGKNKEDLINFYKDELRLAHKLGAKYIVFHPCNIYIKEAFHYDFYYSNMEVLKILVDFINEIFENTNYSFTLLLENLWWSGLRLDNYHEAKYLMDNIKYKNKGFILDTGHMMNNNRNIKNSDDAISYIEKCLNNLKEYKNYIYGIHLNYSNSSEYTKNTIKEFKNKKYDFSYLLKEVYMHIYKIDSHKPINNPKITKIIKSLPIKYLVYELICMNEEERINAIKIQDEAIKDLLVENS